MLKLLNQLGNEDVPVGNGEFDFQRVEGREGCAAGFRMTDGAADGYFAVIAGRSNQFHFVRRSTKHIWHMAIEAKPPNSVR